jgi:hypothetical protein
VQDHTMRTPQSRDGSGRFPKGVSGNPGGRPQGLARATRQLVGEDGMKLAEFWVSIMQDETRRDSDRLEASRLLARQGLGQGCSVRSAGGRSARPREPRAGGGGVQTGDPSTSPRASRTPPSQLHPGGSAPLGAHLLAQHHVRIAEQCSIRRRLRRTQDELLRDMRRRCELCRASFGLDSDGVPWADDSTTNFRRLRGASLTSEER